MSEEQENLKRWMKEAKEMGATHIFDVVDTFDYTHYPVYIMPGDNIFEKKENFSENMQQICSITTVYD